MGRVLRLLRLVKTIQGFDALQLSCIEAVDRCLKDDIDTRVLQALVSGSPLVLLEPECMMLVFFSTSVRAKYICFCKLHLYPVFTWSSRPLVGHLEGFHCFWPALLPHVFDEGTS